MKGFCFVTHIYGFHKWFTLCLQLNQIKQLDALADVADPIMEDHVLKTMVLKTKWF